MERRRGGSWPVAVLILLARARNRKGGVGSGHGWERSSTSRRTETIARENDAWPWPSAREVGVIEVHGTVAS